MRRSQNFIKAPEGWEHCDNYSEPILDKIIAAKIPFDGNVSRYGRPDRNFTTEQFNRMLCKMNIKSVFAILKPHDKYELNNIPESVSFHQTDIVDDFPSESMIIELIRLMDNALVQNPDGRIVVVSNHGYNMAGFVIVTYLVTVKEMELMRAYNLFAAKRPPGIFKIAVSEELKYRFRMNVHLPHPNPPDWYYHRKYQKLQKYQYDYNRLLSKKVPHIEFPEPPEKRFKNQPIMTDAWRDLASYVAFPAEPFHGQKTFLNSMYKRMKNYYHHEFISEESDVKPVIDFQQKHNVFRIMQEIMKSSKYGFCLPDYKNVTPCNIEDIISKDWLVSWSSYCQRYMMLILYSNKSQDVYLISDTHQMFVTKAMIFPNTDNPEKYNCKETNFLRQTILDVDILVDDLPNGNVTSCLISDIIVLNGYPIKEPSYLKRLGIIKTYVMQPRTILTKEQIKAQPLQMRIKSITQKSSMKDIWKKLRGEVPHTMTGLVFYPPVNESFSNLRNSHILHWTDPSFITCNFLFKIAKVEKTIYGQLYPRSTEREIFSPKSVQFVNKLEPYTSFKIENLDEFKKYHEMVVECEYYERLWSIRIAAPNGTLPSLISEIKDVQDRTIHPVPYEALLKNIK